MNYSLCILKVLAITEDLHDVHSLGKEAAAVHHSLMEDLSKVYLTAHLIFYLLLFFVINLLIYRFHVFSYILMHNCTVDNSRLATK